MKIRFTKDAHYTENLAPVVYRAGEVHDLRDDLAERWKRRAMAVDYVEEVALVVTAEEPEPVPVSVTAEEPVTNHHRNHGKGRR